MNYKKKCDGGSPCARHAIAVTSLFHFRHHRSSCLKTQERSHFFHFQSLLRLERTRSFFHSTAFHLGLSRQSTLNGRSKQFQSRLVITRGGIEAVFPTQQMFLTCLMPFSLHNSLDKFRKYIDGIARRLVGSRKHQFSRVFGRLWSRFSLFQSHLKVS